MNKATRTYLRQIEQGIGDLHGALKRAREQAQAQQEAHEKLVKEFWSKGKEASAMHASAQEFDVLQQENEQLREAKREVGERLQRIRDYTKALREDIDQ